VCSLRGVITARQVAKDASAAAPRDRPSVPTRRSSDLSDLHGGAPGENNTPLTAQLVGGVAHGSLTLNADGTYTYTPAADFNGTDSFTYQAGDSLAGESNTATAATTLTSGDDPPAATHD